jgi:hypothetical protein
MHAHIPQELVMHAAAAHIPPRVDSEPSSGAGLSVTAPTRCERGPDIGVISVADERAFMREWDFLRTVARGSP